MYEAKTKQTAASVNDYLAAIEDEARRADCKVLITMMKKATGEPARMWGTGIVGFGSYHYKYASGHEGDSCLAAFASRKGDISVYLMPGGDESQRSAMLARLGRHKMAKACLYIRRLADVDLDVLEEMIVHSVAEVRRMYP